MLILHQTGSVRVGEVVRYTLTYTPSLDRILPPPTHLHVKIKNSSAVPLRAAYLHGPYTLYVACYPSTYTPFHKQERVEEEGAPDFEPQLKAGGTWNSKLTLPDAVRKDAEKTNRQRDEERKSFTWIIEVASQVLFSTTAAVHFEVLVGRDEKSVDLGFHGIVGSGQGAPGKLEDHQQGRLRNSAQSKGVFSKAVRLAVDDTESLWNTPRLPEFDDEDENKIDVQQGPHHGDKRDGAAKHDKQRPKQKKIHLVLLTHGLHSNLGADMLFMKESIDTAAKQAAEDARKQRQERRAQQAADSNDFGREATEERSKSAPEIAVAPTERLAEDEDEDEDEEQVLVRGFNGNAIKTEKGIQYLGKRFAKYVLSMTYPDQPYLPVKKSLSKSITRSLTGSSQKKSLEEDGKKPIHKNSSILKDEKHVNHNLPYKITSISFIGHSLGGLIQTYAIAYIQKHSPEFFELIKPVNFVGMASPFLGLSNENPIYVKFALDFGLVGRTGQDLGLTWRAPTLARNGWGAVIGGLGSDHQKREPDPGAKPLLRILPTGPAYAALKQFRNRTVYSNVVNDGIVPLRTSCLLFLDWRGLERVEKARRDNGLVGTMVEWGFAEMLGQNASAPRRPLPWNDLFTDSADETRRASGTSPDPGSKVPQAEASQGFDDNPRNGPKQNQFLEDQLFEDEAYDQQISQQSGTEEAGNLWTGFLNFFKPQAGKQNPQSHPHRPKNTKIYRRGQTTKPVQGDDDSTLAGSDSGQDPRKSLVRGPSLYSAKSENGGLEAPPKTTFFESAGDLLNPPLPPKDFILDPAARPRTIFHDRVYHPDDIPPPPTKKQRTFLRKVGSKDSSLSAQAKADAERPTSVSSEMSETGSMKIEEKIARAYHKDLSWRKVLVRLEPDAHNNMVVRRMFANAYGWPVVKHMCDTHFAFTAAAQTRDDDERNVERAKPADAAVGPDGEHVKGQLDIPTESRQKEYKEQKLNRPQSADDVRIPRRDADEADDELKGLSSQRFKPQTRGKRTESEIRESRDDLSDLVSHVSAAGQTTGSYSSLNSGKASVSLTRLARSDSGRWSDRFVEDSDSDEDDAQILDELQKAQGRGEYLTQEERSALKRLSTRSTLSKQSGGTQNASTASAKSRGNGERTMPPHILGSEGDSFVTEPGELDPGNQSGPPTPEVKLDEQILGLTGVGLGRSAEERVIPKSPNKGKRGSGVAEHVAFAAQTKKDDTPTAERL